MDTPSTHNFERRVPSIPPRQRVQIQRWERSLAGGLLAGLVGAAAMAVLAIVIAALRGRDARAPLDLIGAAIIPQGLSPGAAAVVGLAIHLTVGCVWGALFGTLLTWHAPRSAAIAGGLVFSAAVWTVMTFGAMPWIHPMMFDRVHPGSLLLFHLPYGLALGFLTPRLRGSEPRPHLGRPRR